jgi:predicted acetyltransferase
MTAQESPWGVAAKRFDLVVDGEVVGTLSLRLEDAPNIIGHAGHIGYGVKEEHRGHGYALAGCRLALPIARAHGLKTIWISCNPDNAERGELNKRRYRLDI